MELKSVDIMSCVRVGGILYALIGLLAGGLFSLFSVLGAVFGSAASGGDGAFLGLLFGMGAVIILPILYGIIGAVFFAIASALYNVIASKVGGIQLELS